MRDRTRSGLAGVGANLVWSTTYPVTQLAMGLGAVPLTALRFVVAAALALPVLAAGRLPHGRSLLAAIGLGLLGYGVAFLLQAEGIREAGASLAALSIALEPLATMLFARIWLGERLSRLAGPAFALALLGTWLLAGAPRPGHDAHLAGILLLVGTVLCYGVYNVLSKPVAEAVGEVPLAAVGALATGIAFAPWLLLEVRLQSISPADFGWAAWLALGPTLLSSLLWFYAVRRAEVGFAVFFMYIQPVAGALLSWVWLHESLSPVEILGGLMLLLAVYLGARPAPKPVPALGHASAGRGPRDS